MCARHLMWEHKKVLNSTPEHAHFLPAKGCARVWVCVCVRWITDICSLQLLVDIFAVSSAAAEAAEAAALAKGICISFKSLNKTSSCMSNNVSGTSATAGSLCPAGYTNWSCHSHVASVRARVAVPVAVSWAGQQLACAGACAPNWPPKILRIRCVVRTWQSMPKAKAKHSHLSSTWTACCLPWGFVQLLFIQIQQIQIQIHICMNICTCIVYDLFYLAFTFYAHAKVKSFICKYAYAVEYAKHMLGMFLFWGSI